MNRVFNRDECQRVWWPKGALFRGKAVKINQIARSSEMIVKAFKMTC